MAAPAGHVSTEVVPLAGGDDDDDNGDTVTAGTAVSSGATSIARTRRRHNSVLVRNIEEKKERLYMRQAGDYAAWIERLLDRPPSNVDLMTSLSSGFILCHIARTIEPSVVAKLEGVYKYPLKEQRVTNLFQSIENIRCFLAASKLIGVKDVDLFEPDDLIEGINKLKVLRTLQVLRKMVDKSYVEISYEQYGNASFDTNFLSAAGKVKRDDLREVRPLDPSLISKLDTTPNEDAQQPTKRSAGTIRIKNNQATSVHVSPATAGLNDGALQSSPASEQSAVIDSEPFPEVKPPEQPIIEADKPATVTDDSPSQETAVPEHRDEALEKHHDEALEHHDETPADGSTVAELENAPRSGAVDTPSETATLPSQTSVESLSSVAPTESDTDTTRHEAFVEENLPEEIMNRLLSKSTPMIFSEEDEESGSGSDEDDWSGIHSASDESFRHHEHEHAYHTIHHEHIIRSLRAEVNELQEILKTEVVAHMKENERITTFTQELEKRAEDAEVRAEQNERLWKSSEERVRELEARLIQMQHENVSLKSSITIAQEAAAAAEAVAKEAEAEALRKSQEAAIQQQKLVSLDKSKIAEESAQPAPSASPQTPLATTDSRPPSTMMEDDPVLLKSDSQQLWRHQPGISTILNTLSDKEQARQEVIFELLSTEEAYAADLDLVIRLFVNPMTAMVDDRTFSKVQLQAIFANIQTLFRVNMAFFNDLKARHKDQWPVVKMVCDIFLKHVKYFQAYADYCGNQKRAMRELNNAKANSALVRSHLEMCQGYRECRKLGLAAFLLLPMQRITKYPLLIKNLMRVTDARHPDYYNANTALNELTKVIDVVNQYAKVGDDLERVYELEDLLDYSKLGKEMSLTNPIIDKDGNERYLIREGNLDRIRLKSKTLTRDKNAPKKPDQLHVILLSDMLLFCRQQPALADASKRQSQHQSNTLGHIFVVQADPLLYNDFRVRNVPDGNNGIGAANIFLISGKAIGTIVLQAESAQEKRAWIGDFSRMGLLAENLTSLQPLTDAPRPDEPAEDDSNSKPAASIVPVATSTVDSSSSTGTTPVLAAPAQADPAPNAQTSTAVLPTPTGKASSSSIIGPVPIQVSRPSGSGGGRLPPRSSSDVAVQLFTSTSSISLAPSHSATLASPLRKSMLQEESPAGKLIHSRPPPGRFVEPPVPNVLLSQLRDPEFDGWLRLKTIGMAHWKLRWFVLKDFCLYYFHNDKSDAKAIGMIMMPSYQVSEVKGSKKNFVFQVAHPSTIAKPYLLLADNREYMDVWIEALTHATMARVARRNLWL